MGRNRHEYTRFRILAERYGVDEQDVRRIVYSFFDTVISDARGLPFDNPKKIYTKDRFNEFIKVRQIPYIGRIGPVYSRYLKWRANESQALEMAPRSSYRRRITQSDIESTAVAVLSGQTPPLLTKKKKSEMFERVWLVGQEGKKSARQVIPKEEK